MRAFLWGRKMPLPNILEFIGTNVTQAGFKAAQEKLLNFLSVEAATKVELSAAVTPKADKTYVDSALTSFQNGAIKTYPTLSAANADIANIALNTKVSVLSETDGGDYYKASASATSLTKSAYDPLTQAKIDATTKANNAEANAKSYSDSKLIINSNALSDYDRLSILKDKDYEFIDLKQYPGLVTQKAIMDATGNITTGVTDQWLMYIIPVEKGDYLQYVGLVGDATTGGTYAVMNQLDSNKNFVSVISSYTTTGASTYATQTAVATQKGFVYVRVNNFTNAGYNLSIRKAYKYKIDAETEKLYLKKVGYSATANGLEVSGLYDTYVIPVEAGDKIKAIMDIGHNPASNFDYAFQFNNSLTYVSTLGTISTRRLPSYSVDLTATQDGYIILITRTGVAINQLKLFTNSEKFQNIVAKSNLKVVTGEYWSAAGVKTTGAGTGVATYYVPVKKGDVVYVKAWAGDSTTGADYGYAAQLARDGTFLSNIKKVTTIGSAWQIVDNVTAVADGFIAVRVRNQSSHDIIKYRRDYLDSLVNNAQTVSLERLPTKIQNQYGYNNAPFTSTSIIQKDGYEYIVLVDDAKNPVVLQRYNKGEWKLTDLSLVSDNPLAAPTADDGHNNYVITVTKNGYIIITGNHHGNVGRAVISNNPHDITSFKKISYTTGIVTYPQFVTHPDGTTQLMYRLGFSGDGAQYINTFNDETLLFGTEVKIVASHTDYSASNPYFQRYGIKDGVLHLCWGYRTNGSAPSTNIGFWYAKSSDKGQTWTDAAGTTIFALPLSNANAEKITDVPAGSGYINQSGGCCDKDGYYHTVYNYFVTVDGLPTSQFRHTWWTGSAWRSEIVSNLKTLDDFLNTGYVTQNTSRPLICATFNGKIYVVYTSVEPDKTGKLLAIDVSDGVRAKEIVLANINIQGEITFDAEYALDSNEIQLLVSKIGTRATGFESKNSYASLLTIQLP